MIANSLRNSFKRRYDIVSRFGGEEFMVVFDASEEDSYALVDKARQNVENLKIPHAKTEVSPYVTISAGVCVMVPSEAVDNDLALKLADDALYESKHGGRNRITLKTYGEVRQYAMYSGNDGHMAIQAADARDCAADKNIMIVKKTGAVKKYAPVFFMFTVKNFSYQP